MLPSHRSKKKINKTSFPPPKHQEHASSDKRRAQIVKIKYVKIDVNPIFSKDMFEPRLFFVDPVRRAWYSFEDCQGKFVQYRYVDMIWC